MYKVVISDYKAQFKIRIREIYDAGEWYFYFYILFIFPWITRICSVDKSYLLYLSIMVPIALNYLLSRMFPNKLSKTLLLCPLTYEEKKQYLENGYCLRILISAVIFVFFQIVNVLCKLTPAAYILAMTIFFFSHAITTNIYRLPKHKTRDMLDREYDLPGNYGAWEIISMLTAIAGGVFLYYGAVENPPVLKTADYVICIVCPLVSICCCLVYVMKYYKPVMELGIMFEEPLKKDKEQAKGMRKR